MIFISQFITTLSMPIGRVMIFISYYPSIYTHINCNDSHFLLQYPLFAPTSASTGCVAHWCVIGHFMGVMAVMKCPKGRFLPPTTPPTPPLSVPRRPAAHHPTPGSIINTDGRKGRQKIP